VEPYPGEVFSALDEYGILPKEGKGMGGSAHQRFGTGPLVKTAQGIGKNVLKRGVPGVEGALPQPDIAYSTG